MTALTDLHCTHQTGPALDEAQARQWQEQVPQWQIQQILQSEKPGVPVLQRRFNFDGFTHTMAFVNAVAALAQQQHHHPELLVGVNSCTVRWSTHSVHGLSLNDFICAAHVDALQP